MFDIPLRIFPNPATNSTVRHIEFGMGVLALSIAALKGVRFATRQQGRNWAQRATPGGDTSTLVLDSYRPYVVVGAARKRYRIGGCGAAEGEFAQENPERGRASTSRTPAGCCRCAGTMTSSMLSAHHCGDDRGRLPTGSPQRI
jgi:hypothetical protein